MNNGFKESYHPYAIITILVWSVAYTLTKFCMPVFGAFALGFLRYFVASLVLVVVLVAKRTGLPKKKDIPWFILSGAMGFSIYIIAFNIGNAEVTAATSSLIIATVPLFTALWARLFYKESLEKYQWLAVAIEFSGILVLLLWGNTISANNGVLWMLLAALLLSGYNIIQKKLTRIYTSIQTSSYSIFIGTLMLMIYAKEAFTKLVGAPFSQYIYLLILGVLSTALAYVSWAKAFSKAEKAAYVSNYMFVTPFFAGIIGFILAKEIPSIQTAVGGAIIFCGVFLFNRKNFKKT